MKLVEAIIRPAKLQEVKTALREMGIQEIMESEIISHCSAIEALSYRGAEYVTDFIRKIKVEIVAADELVSRVVKTIGTIAGTERREDCRIFVLSFVEAL